MRPELFIEWVQSAELTTADWELLLQADDAGPDFNRISAEQIAAELSSGVMHCFRLKPGIGIMLVDVRVGPTGLKRLGIVRMACRRPHSPCWIYAQLKTLLQHTAREWGCEAVETMIYSARLAKALQRVGARAESIMMVLEV